MFETFRYGSTEMKKLWSIESRNSKWCKLWAIVLDVQLLGAKRREWFAGIDTGKLREVLSVVPGSANTGHELEEVRQMLEETYPDLSMLHFGLTTSDITDNADAMTLLQSAVMVGSRLDELTRQLWAVVGDHEQWECLGYTHLMPAETTTIGYRFATNLLELHEAKRQLWSAILGAPLFKLPSGAVGTGAVLKLFMEEENGGAGWKRALTERMEAMLNELTAPLAKVEGNTIPIPLSLNIAGATGQTTPRYAEQRLLQAFDLIAMALARMHTTLRHMSAQGTFLEPPIGKERKVGSSAMPHKRNPALSENICALARMVHANVGAHWTACAEQVFERTLDDSAVRRIVLPQTCLMLEEMLTKSYFTLVRGRFIREQLRTELLNASVDVLTSRILSALVGVYRGEISRTKIYDTVQELALQHRYQAGLFRSSIEVAFPRLRWFYGEMPELEERLWDVLDTGFAQTDAYLVLEGQMGQI